MFKLIYLDIRYAIQQMIRYTYSQIRINTDNSQLLKYLTSVFYFGELATEATINFPNRIKIYSNPNYD